jgi:DNA invertase Pin-like site-specific DNA recombinase
MANGNFIAYYRVSTQKQGKSGLGIEAQQEAVRTFLNGGNWKLIAEVTEVESGKRNDRPKLAEALRLCRLHNATLVIARLDRLSRNANFLLSLQDSGVRFVAADMPEANEMMVGMMAIMAQAERKRISANTKAALAAAKARGVKLGGFRANAKAPADAKDKSLEVRRAKAAQRAGDLSPIISELREAGISSFAGIAKALNERGIPTARGGEWQAVQVQRVLARLEG